MGNEAEVTDAAQLLNEMKEEINQGLIGIEFKKAYSGSVVLDVKLKSFTWKQKQNYSLF